VAGWVMQERWGRARSKGDEGGIWSGEGMIEGRLGGATMADGSLGR
jgi:hypothetical protein